MLLKDVQRYLDHIIPLSTGGTHSKTNIQYICGKCNLIKGYKTEKEFKKYLSQLEENNES